VDERVELTGAGGEARAKDEARAEPRYFLVWGGLAVLTLVEVGVAFFGLPRHMTVVVLLGLAVWKALLVALYFMHLRFEPNGLRILAAAPLLPAAVLILLVLLEY
jgi:cytochrome c oxidase subunit IV